MTHPPASGRTTDNGSATAELAIGMLSITALLIALITITHLGATTIQCHATAGTAARLAGRGTPQTTIQALVQRQLGHHTTTTTTKHNGTITVTIHHTTTWTWWGNTIHLPTTATATFADETTTPTP